MLKENPVIKVKRFKIPEKIHLCFSDNDIKLILNNVKNDYVNLLNANSIKKKKSVAILMQNNNTDGRRQSVFSQGNKNNNGTRNSSQFQQQQF